MNEFMFKRPDNQPCQVNVPGIDVARLKPDKLLRFACACVQCLSVFPGDLFILRPVYHQQRHRRYGTRVSQRLEGAQKHPSNDTYKFTDERPFKPPDIVADHPADIPSAEHDRGNGGSLIACRNTRDERSAEAVTEKNYLCVSTSGRRQR